MLTNNCAEPANFMHFIVDGSSRWGGAEQSFVICMQGYQMHPHEWIPKSYLKNCVALEEWDAEQAKAPSAL